MNQKNNLYQVIKKLKGNELMSYFDFKSILNLSLVSKRYYLLLKPILQQMKLDFEQKNKKTQKYSKKNEKKLKKQKVNKVNQEGKQLEQVQITIQKINIEKAKKIISNRIQDLKYIDKCPINSSYLKKKFQSGMIVGFINNNTGQVMYVNRSIIDPRLNYDKGGFDMDDDNTYQELYDNQQFSIDYDFDNQQSLSKRQKDILVKLEQKKVKKQKLQQLDFVDQLKKTLTLRKIGIILCFGGSFSFGIYQGQKCIIHKSDKKYVCRKKAGQRQLNKDKQSGGKYIPWGHKQEENNKKCTSLMSVKFQLLTRKIYRSVIWCFCRRLDQIDFLLSIKAKHQMVQKGDYAQCVQQQKKQTIQKFKPFLNKSLNLILFPQKNNQTKNKKKKIFDCL